MGPILVATDLSPRSDIALRRAAQLAHATGAELHVVHILDEDLPAALLNDQSAAIEAGLTAMIDLEDWPAGVVPRVDVEVGHLARMVPKLVAERKAGLIVMGSHRDRGLADLMGQPTLARLMAAVDVPILVAVSSAGGAAWSKAIVGWDFSPAAKAAAQLAKTLAPDVTLSLLNVWTDPAQSSPYAFDMGGVAGQNTVPHLEQALAEASASLGNAPGPGDTPHAAKVGAPAAVLVREARDTKTDVLVIGRHARSGIARFLLGETAARAALHAPCDVLIAPPG